MFMSKFNQIFLIFNPEVKHPIAHRPNILKEKFMTMLSIWSGLEYLATCTVQTMFCHQTKTWRGQKVSLEVITRQEIVTRRYLVYFRLAAKQSQLVVSCPGSSIPSLGEWASAVQNFNMESDFGHFLTLQCNDQDLDYWLGPWLAITDYDLWLMTTTTNGTMSMKLIKAQ